MIVRLLGLCDSLRPQICSCQMLMKPRYKKSALKDVAGFRDALAEWFALNGKDYPWRRTRDPYAILVSEVMLQQTQIATVLQRNYYQRFLETFPDLESLSRAGDEQLLKAWEGLGYYRRVKMLRATAQAVMVNHAGKFPSELSDLMQLPGVGRYTAGALRSFAFEKSAAVVDGNVVRIFTRLMEFSAPSDDSVGQKQMWTWAEALADPLRPRVYNSALMELGQTICRPGVPNCLSCPVADFCKAKEPETLPRKRPRTPITPVNEHAIWMRDATGHLLLHQESEKRREGLWKLPTREAAELIKLPILTEESYTITRYRVSMRVHDGRNFKAFRPAVNEIWHTQEEALALAMPSPFRRVIERLLGES